MLTSWFYYLITLLLLWYAGLLGATETFWTGFDLPVHPERPPPWSILMALCFTGLALFGLFRTYWAVEKMICGGTRTHKFVELAARLRSMAIGLLFFWLGYNLITGLVPLLATTNIPPNQNIGHGWDPLDIDIIFVVLAISLYAISDALIRAAKIEEENKLFM